MKFKDQMVRCGACGKQFVYTVREQRRRAEQGLPLDVPAFCSECRGADVRLAEASTPVAAPGQPTTMSSPSPKATEGGSRGHPRADGGRRPGAGGSARPHGPRSDSQGRGGRPGGARTASSSRSPEGGRPAGRGRTKTRAQAQRRQTELRIRYTGSVKWFDEDRGYGFIAQEDGGEVFVHCSAVLGEAPARLEKGQPVEYEVERTDRGLQAVDVVPLAW